MAKKRPEPTFPRKPASSAEIRRAHDLYGSGMSIAQIGRELNRPRQTVQSWLRDGINTKGIENPPDESEIAIGALEERVRDLDAQLKTIRKDNISAERVKSIITGMEEGLPQDPPEWSFSPAPPGSPGIPVALWSDWHIGEVVFPDQVGNVNEFNMGVAQRRVKTLVEKIIDLSFNHQVNPHYPGIVVCLGGDMVSGLIHDELIETMEGPFAEQIKETFSMIAAAIKALAERFGKVFVPCVPGNHGRMHHKPRAKNRALDSYEYLIYCFLEKHFEDDNRVQFHVATQTDVHFTVAGHRFLLTHGDSTGARGGDGFIGAIGPIVRGEKKVREVSGYTNDDYDTALMGHYHTKVSLDSVIVNPTLKGYDEYARNVLRARPEPPAQMLLYVHQDYGIVDERRIFLEKKANRSKKTAWVSWKEDK